MIPRNIGANVEIGGEGRQARIANVRTGKQRTGLGIALTIEQEVLGKCARQDAHIGLNAAGRDASRVARVPSGADDPPCCHGVVAIPGQSLL